MKNGKKNNASNHEKERILEPFDKTLVKLNIKL